MGQEAQTIYGKHSHFIISPETTIMATRNILVKGVLVPDRVSALENYISAFEKQIKADIVELDAGEIVTKHWFSFSPDVGLGLVGFGDAMLEAAQTEPQRAPEYLDLAKRAYRSSGYGNTLYVGNKLLGIGDLPARAYAVVPLEELTPAQLGRLGIPMPRN